MSNSPRNTTATTPVRPLSPFLMDRFQSEDNHHSSFDNVLPTCHCLGSKRCPTPKDYSEKIKKLQQENFQLRVRIYLSEQKSGVKPGSSNLAVLYSHLPHLQNFPGNANAFSTQSTAPSSVSTIAGSVLESVNGEVDKLKSDKNALQGQLRAYEEDLQVKQRRIAELNAVNARWEVKQNKMAHELANANMAIQKLNQELGQYRRSSSRSNDDAEVDKMAGIAFNQIDELELINAEWEEKLATKVEEIRILDGKWESAQRKLESARRKICDLKAELKKHETDKLLQESKIREMTNSLKEMGTNFVKLQQRNEKLERKLCEIANENGNKAAVMPCSNKLTAIKELVGLLQSKMEAQTDFVETFLQRLESQKAVSLTELSDDNKENLLRSILDKLFAGPISTAEAHQVPKKSNGVQCELLEPSLQTLLESANTQVDKLKSEIRILERVNVQLGHEKKNLLSQVKSLGSSVQVLKMTNQGDGIATDIEATTSKLKAENRKLSKCLTIAESALQDLRAEHGLLVEELTTLKNACQESNRLKTPDPTNSCSEQDDGTLNDKDSKLNDYEQEINNLRTMNRKLALKLKQTRQALDSTLVKLVNSTPRDREQVVENAVCDQLNATYTVSRHAKRGVGKFTNSQCLVETPPTS